jgi:hypothetical protein
LGRQKRAPSFSALPLLKGTTKAKLLGSLSAMPAEDAEQLKKEKKELKEKERKEKEDKKERKRKEKEKEKMQAGKDPKAITPRGLGKKGDKKLPQNPGTRTHTHTHTQHTTHTHDTHTTHTTHTAHDTHKLTDVMGAQCLEYRWRRSTRRIRRAPCHGWLSGWCSISRNMRCLRQRASSASPGAISRSMPSARNSTLRARARKTTSASSTTKTSAFTRCAHGLTGLTVP